MIGRGVSVASGQVSQAIKGNAHGGSGRWRRPTRSQPRARRARRAGIEPQFGAIGWTERFRTDAEKEPGQATRENGEHLPLIR
jgi:hypothetical protein